MNANHSPDLTVELTDTEDPADRAAVSAVLAAYTATRIDIPRDPATMAVLLRDAQGEVEGGFWATRRFGWLHLELAFVPEHRRSAGLGGAMLSALEREVIAVQGRGVRTETGSFQAPRFYRRHGYEVCGVLDGWPPGHHALSLVKTKGLGEADTAMTVTYDPDPAARAAIRSGLMALTNTIVGEPHHRPLSVLLRKADGTVAGGLIGHTSRSWLHVELFALPERARDGGLGRRILAMVEQEAIARGCVGSHLATHSYQARPFYEKQGYEMFGQIADYLPGESRFLMVKRFG